MFGSLGVEKFGCVGVWTFGTPRSDLVAIGDAALAKVIGRDLDRHLVADRDLDEELPHLARNVRQHFMPVFELNLVHRRRENLRDGSCDFNRLIFFFRHAQEPCLVYNFAYYTIFLP